MNAIIWLDQLEVGPWLALAEARRRGVRVPNGFVVTPEAPEEQIRDAYDALKQLEKTHFVAVRGPSHALLDVLGNDALIRAMRRLWNETPDDVIFVQRMVNAEWCGKVAIDEKEMRVNANEGMVLLDPDAYFLSRTDGQCTRRTLQERQRKVIREVDGASRTIESDAHRQPLSDEQLRAIAALTEGAPAEITWALDDTTAWLLGLRPPSLPS